MHTMRVMSVASCRTSAYSMDRSQRKTSAVMMAIGMNGIIHHLLSGLKAVLLGRIVIEDVVHEMILNHCGGQTKPYAVSLR